MGKTDVDIEKKKIANNYCKFYENKKSFKLIINSIIKEPIFNYFKQKI